MRLLCFRGRPGQSLVTETLPDEDEEEEAWERFAAETLLEEDQEQAVSDPYL